MEIQIHLLEANKKPGEEKIIKTNCGKKIPFNPFKGTFWYYEDGRTCEKCLEIHRKTPIGKLTFAINETPN